MPYDSIGFFLFLNYGSIEVVGISIRGFHGAVSHCVFSTSDLHDKKHTMKYLKYKGTSVDANPQKINEGKKENTTQHNTTS